MARTYRRDAKGQFSGGGGGAAGRSKPRNTVKPYRPATAKGAEQQINRQATAAIKRSIQRTKGKK